MKRKKAVISLVALIIGVFLICVGLYIQARQSSARSDVSDISGWIKNKEAKGLLESGAEHKIGKYDSAKTLCYVGGALFIIGGILGFSLGNKKRD